MKLLMAILIALNPLVTLANSADMRARYIYKEQYKKSVIEKIEQAQERLTLAEEKLEQLCSLNSKCENALEFAELTAEIAKETQYIQQTRIILVGIK